MSRHKTRGIPTKYRGRWYRSRLEARWAAFFDLLHWQHEYEPFDLDGWIPDFLLSGDETRILVEVKPISEFDDAVAGKMARGVADRDLDVDKLLLLGVAPEVRREADRRDRCWIGWAQGNVDHPVEPAPWYPATLVWLADHFEPRFSADIATFEKLPEPFWHFHFEQGVADRLPEQNLFHRHTMDLWAEATNRVQWKPAMGSARS